MRAIFYSITLGMAVSGCAQVEGLFGPSRGVDAPQSAAPAPGQTHPEARPDAAAPPRVVQLCGAEAWLETVRTPPGDSPAHRARAAGDAVGSAQEEGGQRATLRSFAHWHGSNRELHADWEAKSVFVSLTGEFHTVLSSDSL